MENLKPNGTSQSEERQIKSIFAGLRRFLRHRFDLSEDSADQEEVIENIRKGVEFRGTNLWILIFAIVVASVGLNVNSTAVIIGAMLISPLMGPIMGIGLSLGINDFELFKRSARNFLFAVTVSLIVSTLYFMISPLSTAQSELLARTTPTIWDVLIATFGGLAGIVAQTRKDRTSIVIPGVAIATALMPPLCTAGFGLATGEWSYFGGAFYLFFINAVFIAFATYFIVRFMKYDRKKQLDPARAKRVNRTITAILVATMVPSVILAYGIVQRSIFETSAAHYIKEVLTFEKSEVVSSTINFDSRGKAHRIEVVMVGDVISADAIETARNQLKAYSLKNTELFVRQANKNDVIDNSTLNNALRTTTQILDEKNAEINALQTQLNSLVRDTLPASAMAREINSIWTGVSDVAISRADVYSTDGRKVGDRVVCVISLKEGAHISPVDNDKIKRWIAERTTIENVKLIVE